MEAGCRRVGFPNVKYTTVVNGVLCVCELLFSYFLLLASSLRFSISLYIFCLLGSSWLLYIHIMGRQLVFFFCANSFTTLCCFLDVVEQRNKLVCY